MTTQNAKASQRPAHLPKHVTCPGFGRTCRNSFLPGIKPGQKYCEHCAGVAAKAAARSALVKQDEAARVERNLRPPRPPVLRANPFEKALRGLSLES